MSHIAGHSYKRTDGGNLLLKPSPVRMKLKLVEAKPLKSGCVILRNHPESARSGTIGARTYGSIAGRVGGEGEPRARQVFKIGESEARECIQSVREPSKVASNSCRHTTGASLHGVRLGPSEPVVQVRPHLKEGGCVQDDVTVDKQ